LRAEISQEGQFATVEDSQFSHLGEQCKIARKPPEKSVEPTQKLHKMVVNVRREQGKNMEEISPIPECTAMQWQRFCSVTSLDIPLA
jgi:hypothetical protein